MRPFPESWPLRSGLRVSRVSVVAVFVLDFASGDSSGVASTLTTAGRVYLDDQKFSLICYF